MRLGRRAALGALLLPRLGRASAAARLIVVGGGFGGAAAARYARAAWPALAVTLVEPRPRFVTCPYGNLLLAGLRGLETITFGYQALRAEGIAMVEDRVAAIDPPARRLRLSGGETLGYDKLILSPGIGLRWGALPGYDRAAAEISRMPGSARTGRNCCCCAGSWKPCPRAASSVSASPPIPIVVRPDPMSGLR